MNAGRRIGHFMRTDKRWSYGDFMFIMNNVSHEFYHKKNGKFPKFGQNSLIHAPVWISCLYLVSSRGTDTFDSCFYFYSSTNHCLRKMHSNNAIRFAYACVYSVRRYFYIAIGYFNLLLIQFFSSFYLLSFKSAVV